MKNKFSLKEKYMFWKRKWLKEHLALIITFILLNCVAMLILYSFNSILLSIAPIAIIVEYMCLRNKMMIYIEHKLYD